jgi:hypothetical protein
MSFFERKNSSTLASCLVLALLNLLISQPPAIAKLGEEFTELQSRIASNFKFKGTETKQNRSYYHYTMVLDKATEQAAPGFDGGLTVTVEKNGVIVGQSMLIRLGDNHEAGKALAALHTLDFAFESLGRPNPRTKQEVQRELQSYTAAVSKALAGTPQNIRYADTPGKITVSKRPDGSIAIAATAG